jgi:hypothetical protein
MHCPIIVIDRMNPDTPQQLLETPGMKCKYEDHVRFHSVLHKYNHLMVVAEEKWSLVGNDDMILISFWDLRDEPYLFKENNFIDMVPSELLSEYELGEGSVGRICGIDIQLSSVIMAVNLLIKTNHPKKEIFPFFTLLYRINTTEPSRDPSFLQFVQIVKPVEPVEGTTQFFYPVNFMNEKYLIYPIVGTDCRPALEVHKIDTLLLAVDTRSAPRKVLPVSSGNYVLEPGMSDRLAVFNTEENRLTILDLVSTNPMTIIDTIQWNIIGQPSEKYDLPDKKFKTYNIGGIWCCGSFLILQRLESLNTCMGHGQWAFKLSIADPGTVEKRPEVISQIKDIFDSKISYPRSIMLEDCFIDLKGIVYVVTDTSGDAEYLTVNCAQFHNTNAAQSGYIGALEDSSSDILGGSKMVDEVVNWIEKAEDRMGKQEEETEEKEK